MENKSVRLVRRTHAMSANVLTCEFENTLTIQLNANSRVAMIDQHKTINNKRYLGQMNPNVHN